MAMPLLDLGIRAEPAASWLLLLPSFGELVVLELDFESLLGT
jgi:hypothetical protein